MAPLLFLALLLAGCTIKPSPPPTYHLPLARCPQGPTRSLGLYPISLPDYFIDDRFPYKRNGLLGYLRASFAPAPETFATRCALRWLGACLYPWECSSQPKKRLKIEIEEFYYDMDRGEILLQGSINGSPIEIREGVHEDPIEAAFRAYRRLLELAGRLSR
ncbi:MAG: hypothetical protein C6I00_03145 [Nitratiruptor sp.]|nr:hypothetical protein [Nitratiruptor sp.]NPA83455.1 hypothetical protein [Campylobacterota bacterium]